MLRKWHDNRLVKGLVNFGGLLGGLPLAIEVLVAFGKEQVVSARFINLHDIVAELQVVDEIGLGATPVRLFDQFFQCEAGGLAVPCEGIVDT